MLAERARIARELHDSVAQTLYAITLSASRALSLIDQTGADKLQHVMEDVIQLANGGQTELRALVSNLRSDVLVQQCVTQVLSAVVSEMQQRYGVAIRMTLGSEPDVSPAAKEAIARIAQEALNNAARHAEALQVELTLQVEAADVVLSISDDGRGFDPLLVRSGHFGLQSMRERAEAVGGTLELVSAEGHGTHIRFRVARRRA